MQIATTHIRKLLSTALDNAQEVHGMWARGDTEANPTVVEGLTTAIRMARHAAAELEAELHKAEYGYDIS